MNKPQSRAVWRIVVGFLLVASAAEFVVRVPLRLGNSSNWNDFLSPYIQSRAWIQGQDPYNSQNLVRFWPSDLQEPDFVIRESTDSTLVERHGIPSPYPPTSFVVLAPLAVLPWTAAQWVWISISILTVAWMLIAVANFARIRLTTTRGLFFLAFCIGLAPLHTGLATENPAVFAVALSVIALWLAEQHRDSVAGLFIALSICLKPPIGLCFLFFYLTSRRWKILLVACGAVALVALAAAGRMWFLGVPWIASYNSLVQHMFAPGAINDFTSANPVWFQMVNLQGPLYEILWNSHAAKTLSLFAGITLLLVWTVLKLASEEPAMLLEISALAVLSLLAVYHRFYDAGLLILPVAWVLSPRNRAPAWMVSLVIVLTTPFLIPGAVVLSQVSSRLSGRLEAVHSRWWSALVIAHEVWTLLLLSILLLYAMRRQGRRFEVEKLP
jgi:hypothetical protein